MPVNSGSVLSGLAGGLTAGAGLIHVASAAGHHGHDRPHLLFAACAMVQLVLGAAVAVRPRRSILLAVATVNLGAGAAWAVSRTTGLPLLDGPGGPPPVGLQDLTATLVEVVAAGAAALAVRHLEPLPLRPLLPVWAFALVPALVGMSAPHVHSEGRYQVGAARGLAADPIFSGADTAHASQDELAAARALIVATRDSVLRSFPDEASVLAAGYRSIGDGRIPGTYEHFVHAGYLTDGRELDPGRIESIVLENTGQAKRVASAMYILELGRTMADAPALAGRLAVWHDHQNLCWEESGVRLAGFLVEGRCVPRGTFRPTPPMLHVWLHDHRCGPFAAIDGHGTACSAHHAAGRAAGRS